MQKLLLKENVFCDPEKIGDKDLTFQNGQYGMSVGLLQIRMLPGRDVTVQELQDPETNIFWAHKIWKQEGYDAWRNSMKKIKLDELSTEKI